MGAPPACCAARSSSSCTAARSKPAASAGGSDSSATYVAGSANDPSSCSQTRRAEGVNEDRSVVAFVQDVIDTTRSCTKRRGRIHRKYGRTVMHSWICSRAMRGCKENNGLKAWVLTPLCPRWQPRRAAIATATVCGGRGVTGCSSTFCVAASFRSTAAARDAHPSCSSRLACRRQRYSFQPGLAHHKLCAMCDNPAQTTHTDDDGLQTWEVGKALPIV